MEYFGSGYIVRNADNEIGLCCYECREMQVELGIWAVLYVIIWEKGVTNTLKSNSDALLQTTFPLDYVHSLRQYDYEDPETLMRDYASGRFEKLFQTGHKLAQQMSPAGVS